MDSPSFTIKAWLPSSLLKDSMSARTGFLCRNTDTWAKNRAGENIQTQECEARAKAYQKFIKVARKEIAAVVGKSGFCGADVQNPEPDKGSP